MFLWWLRRKARSENTSTRQAAARGLAKHRDPTALASLAKLTRDPLFDVRLVAVQELAEHGDERSIALLVRALADSNEIPDRAERGLVRIDPGWSSRPEAREAIPGLLEALDGRNMESVGRAADALGRLGDFRAVEPLIGALARDDGSSFGIATSKIIGALVVLRGVGASAVLQRKLTSSDERTLRGVIKALADMNTSAATTAIAQHLTHADERVRRAALEAVSKLAGRGAIPHLERILSSEKEGWSLKNAALDALVSIADETGYLTLSVVLASDADSMVRRSAISAMRKLFEAAKPLPESAHEALIGALADDHYEVRYGAKDLLEVSGPAWRAAVPKQLPTLIEKLQHPKSRLAAAYALGVVGDRTAVPHLIKKLGDSEANVRVVVADALGELGDARAIEHLERLAKDPHQVDVASDDAPVAELVYPVREAAARAIALIRSNA